MGMAAVAAAGGGGISATVTPPAPSSGQRTTVMLTNLPACLFLPADQPEPAPLPPQPAATVTAAAKWKANMSKHSMSVKIRLVTALEEAFGSVYGIQYIYPASTTGDGSGTSAAAHVGALRPFASPRMTFVTFDHPLR
jgi:hypothetical protein